MSAKLGPECKQTLEVEVSRDRSPLSMCSSHVFFFERLYVAIRATVDSTARHRPDPL